MIFNQFAHEKQRRAWAFAAALTFVMAMSYLYVNLIHQDSGVFFENTVQLVVVLAIHFTCLYIVYQVFDYVIAQAFANPKLIHLTEGYFVELFKLSIAMWIAREFLYWLSPARKPESLTSLFFLTLIYASVPAVFLYKFRRIKDQATRSKLAQTEAQYNLLESQMQPHFLFNSLNVLSELIYVEPDLAASMTQKLADLYREILENSKNKFSSLESEISILKKYVEIQKIRFEDRIRFSVRVSDRFYKLHVPSLMLQTLVENAIKHGISPIQSGGEICLSVNQVKQGYEVCIWNTGVLYSGHKVKGSGRSTGLRNTINRLDLIYGKENHEFKIYSDNERTYVKFFITGGMG